MEAPMFSALAPHPQTATKRIAVHFACVSVSFLAIVWFGLLQKIQASENTLPHRQVSAAPTKVQPKLVAGYGKLPLSFEANQGQSDARVRFTARGGGYTIFLTDDEAVLALKKPSAGSSQLSASRISGPESWKLMERSGKLSAPVGRLQQTTDNGPRTRYPKSRIENQVVRLRLVGANVPATVTGAEELPGKSNYFIGNDPKKWRTNVPTCAKVRYHNVYPGVDLEYYGNQGGQLEYDFVVAPGADPNQIKLGFAGAEGMRVDAASGDLVLKVGDDVVRFHKPVVYQPAVAAVSSSPSPSVALASGSDARHSSLVTRHCSFALASNNQVAFRVAGYDPKRVLVIDPVLSYSTYLGGSSTDVGQGIAVDTSGNAYVTGWTDSSDFPTVYPIQATYAGPPPAGNSPCCNVFVAKLNLAGSALVYSTFLGGSSGDTGSGIAVDSAGNAYVTGQTFSTNFPTVNPLQATNKATPNTGNPTAFVAKLNSTGSALIYSTYLGGSSVDMGYGIAADSSGNAYVTGVTGSTDFPTANPLQATYEGPSWTAFVAALNSTGSALVYSTYLGGSSGGDWGNGIAVDSAGNAYVTGVTGSTDFPTVNPLQATSNASEGTSFVAKFNAAGSALVYSTYLGGSESDAGTGIAVDPSGNAYVTGRTDSSDFPTVNPIQATFKGGGDDAFVAELNAAGSALVYSTYLGGSGTDEGYGIAVDSSGNAYVTGWTTSRDFPTVNPIQSVNLSGKYDLGTAYVAKLNSTGSALVYSTYLGGSNVDYGYGIAVDSFFNAYVTGCTASTDFPTVNPLEAALAGGYDAFVAKIGAVTLSPASLSFSNQMVGTTSPAQPATLSNIGSASLTISSIGIAGSDAGDFAIAAVGTTCSTSAVLAAGTSCTINVTFTPTIAGSESASLSVSDSIASSPQTVQLTGTGTLSAPNVSPTSLSFNNQLVGTASSPQPVTMTNTASAPLTVSAVAISSGWTQGNDCLRSIPANGRCTINVSFQPTVGGPQTGTVTITDDATNSPQIVTLSGTALAPVVSLSATILSFSGQSVSTTSAPQTLTLTNTGNGALTPLTITRTSDFAQTNTCAGSLAPGGSCTISVTFTPTAGGGRSGALTLTDNAGNSPQTVILSGTGLAPVVSLSAATLSFAGQTVSTTSPPQTLTLTNTGAGALTHLAVTPTGDFTQTNTCSASLAPSANCTISVTFTPTAGGSRSGTLSLTDNAGNSPQTVQLSGTGMDFAMSSPTTSQTVSAGQTANYSLTMAPQGGFNQAVNLTCSGAPSLATCTLTPNSVTLNGKTSTAVTVAVSTTAGSLAPPRERVLPPGLKGLGRMFWLYALLGLASVVALAGARRRRAAYLAGAGLLLVMLWGACGGGQAVHTPGTPPGTYTVDVTRTVTSTAPSSTLTHDFKFTLTVD
jgi:hypothetical protein